jgi:hypothetical protein
MSGGRVQPTSSHVDQDIGGVIGITQPSQVLCVAKNIKATVVYAEILPTTLASW